MLLNINKRILLTVFILFFFKISIYTAVDIMFEEDFEDEAVGEQPGTITPTGSASPSWDPAVLNVNGGAVITAGSNIVDGNNISGNNTHKYFLSINNGGQNVFWGANFNQSTERFVTVEYDVLLTAPLPTVHPAGEIVYADGIENLDATATTTRIAIHIEFSDETAIPDGAGGADNGIYYISGEDNHLEDYTDVPPNTETWFGTFLADTWYRVQVVADQISKNYDVRVTNKITGIVIEQLNVPYNDPLAGYIRKMWFGVSASNPNVYFDNIVIYQDPDPPANPTIVKTIARPGSPYIYVEFNVPVEKAGGIGPIDQANFGYNNNAFNPLGTAINSVIDIDGAATRFRLNLNNNLSFEDMIDEEITTTNIVNSNSVGMSTNTFTITEVGIDWYTNVRIVDLESDGDNWSISDLDGDEDIPFEGMRIRATINIQNYTGYTPELYYDLFTTESNAEFWEPEDYDTIEKIKGRNTGSNTWEFDIALNDTRISSRRVFSFMLKYGKYYCYRGSYPPGSTDFYKHETFIARFRLKLQNNNVSVMNNVIDPRDGERVKLMYILEKSGPVSIVVYDLNSDIVKVLKSENESSGIHYVFWDGRNENNKIVARGVYFIRIRAPGIFNQIRKVLITK